MFNRRSLTIFLIFFAVLLFVGILYNSFSPGTNDAEPETVSTTEKIVYYPGGGDKGTPLTAEGRKAFSEVVKDFGNEEDPEKLLDPPDAPVACRYSVYSKSGNKEIELFLVLFKGERLATIENVPLVGSVTSRITDQAYEKLTNPEPWLEK